MTTTNRHLAGRLLSTLTLAVLAACGGGGGGSDDATGGSPQTPQAIALGGVVATGAAFSEGRVQVTDRTGAVVGTSAVIGSDGVYSVTLATGAQAPFVLVASRTTEAGETQSLVSVTDSATGGTVNVTPVTNLIASRLAPGGDPLALPAAVQADASRASAGSIATAIADVNTVLAPLLAANETSLTVNPLTVPITTDGTGYDRLLDSMQVTITPQSDSSSHVEVGFKVQQADAGAQPPKVQFTSTATAAELAGSAAAVTIAAADLVPVGTSARIAEFLDGLTACYALPLETRLDNASSTDASVDGTAANVVAPACRNAFAGGDPANFLSNGLRVGTGSGGGAFTGLFRRASVGVVFSQGSYEFTRVNGDIVIGYRTRDTAGGEVFDTMVVRADAATGRLQAIGNQYAFPGGVQAYHQRRHFVTPDSTGASQALFDYASTGYTVHVPNKVDAEGRPIFDRVVVTTPRGSHLTLKPLAGISYLVLLRANGSTAGSTNFLRLRSQYDTPGTPGHPRDLDTSLFFVPTDLDEDEIAAVAHQAVWKYEYFLAGNTGDTPDATQHYKTRSRALTLGELSRKGLARLTDGTLQSLLARPMLYSQLLLPTDGPLRDIGYTVPRGGPAADGRADLGPRGHGHDDPGPALRRSRDGALHRHQCGRVVRERERRRRPLQRRRTGCVCRPCVPEQPAPVGARRERPRVRPHVRDVPAALTHRRAPAGVRRCAAVLRTGSTAAPSATPSPARR